MVWERNISPERMLEEFHRYIRAENSRRKGAFGLNFDVDEGRRFVDQCQQLKQLEALLADSERPGPDQADLSAEVHYPGDLTDAQLLYYLFCKSRFAKDVIEEGQDYYGRLYLLELANGLCQESSQDALLRVFDFWDVMVDRVADKEAHEDYLLRLSLSFLTAHPNMAEAIREGLIRRDLYWRYDLIGEIRQGRFQRAGLFVARYARLLKPEEISGDKPYIKAVWGAMPTVFARLDSCFGDNAGHLFRRFLTAGEEISTQIELLPVYRRALGEKRRIPLSDTCYLDSHQSYGSVHRDRWARTEWVLKEGAQDFLYVIHLYTESFVREYYKAPKRKRTADRFLKKKYARTGDDRQTINAMKEVMRDERFERAIGEGVAVYMAAHPPGPGTVKVKKTRKERQAELIYQMDHEQLSHEVSIDYEKIRQARSDAESVLTMLHEGEIDYGKQRD